METASRSMAAIPQTTQQRPTETRRSVITAAVIVAGGILWYLFRPELLFIDKSVNEAFPAASATAMSSVSPGQALAQGDFHSAAHETKGTATLFQLADGKRVLRLVGFETSNGPDVHVLLGKATDATDNEAVKSAGYVDLGSLKGSIGDQNYNVPADVNLAEYNSVTIWCNRFSANFGTAPLTMN